MPTQRDHGDCPLCLRKMAKGDQMCRDCRERGTPCPLCSDTHCPNAWLGCPKEGSPAEMKKHEVICYYRWIRCAWHLQCGKHEISLSEYRKHLEEVHRPYIKRIHFNEEDEIVLKTEAHSLVRTGNVLRIDGVYFVRRCLLDLDRDILLICLHYIGENQDATKYTYKVSINQGFHNAKYTYTSYCLPYVESSASCMTLPNSNVLKPSKIFLTKDYLREINYSMTIKRV